MTDEERMSDEEVKLRRSIDMLRKRSPVQARIADEIEARLNDMLGHRCTICGALAIYDGTPPSIEFSGRGRASRHTLAMREDGK